LNWSDIIGKNAYFWSIFILQLSFSANLPLTKSGSKPRIFPNFPQIGLGDLPKKLGKSAVFGPFPQIRGYFEPRFEPLF
jgi:hypothetical protein